MSDYNTDFYAWTQAQAQAIRAKDWAALDVDHVAEEIEDLWKHDDHHLTMLAMSLEDSPRVRPLLEGCLPDAYAWARAHVLRRRTPPLREPPETCPWPLDALLDEHWWPPEAPGRLP